MGADPPSTDKTIAMQEVENLQNDILKYFKRQLRKSGVDDVATAAHDRYQETVENVRSRKLPKSSDNIHGWVWTVAKNTLIDWIRLTGRRIHAKPAGEKLVAVADRALLRDCGRTIPLQRAVEAREQLRELHQRHPHFELIVVMDGMGHTATDVRAGRPYPLAGMVGVAEGTIRARLSRAREELGLPPKRDTVLRKTRSLG